MPTSWFDEATGKARKLKALLSGEDNASAYLKVRNKRQEFKQLRDEIAREKREAKQVKGRIEEIKEGLAALKQENKQIKEELRTVEDPAEREGYEERQRRILQERSRLREELRATKENKRAEKIEHKRMKKDAQQEIFQLEKQRRDAREQWTGAGALPDFVIIGGKKCGTTYLYDLLGQHPLVQRAASKELHFFDALFEEGPEWYRQCFPAPRWEDGQRTITGEASPYIAHLYAPERMAQVVPQARLIALLRDPVERAYSDYQMVARKDREHKTFEEAIGLEDPAEAGKARPEEGETPEAGDLAALDEDSEYLSRGIYIDQLLRWREFFPSEQLLVLKSEDFFEEPVETLKVVLQYLELPEWEPAEEHLEGGKRNEGGYEEEMDPLTRRRLEEYFEPHNRRLYDYLGRDFGW